MQKQFKLSMQSWKANLQAKARRLRRERHASDRWGSWPIGGSPRPLIQPARLGFRGFSCSLGLPLGDTAPLLQQSLRAFMSASFGVTASNKRFCWEGGWAAAWTAPTTLDRARLRKLCVQPCALNCSRGTTVCGDLALCSDPACRRA